MLTYFAVTQRNGRWEYICSGPDPQEVYHEAVDILAGAQPYGENDETALAPEVECQLDSLRVVTEESAKEVYHVTLDRVQVEDSAA